MTGLNFNNMPFSCLNMLINRVSAMSLENTQFVLTNKVASECKSVLVPLNQHVEYLFLTYFR